MKEWNRIFKNKGEECRYYNIMEPHEDIPRVLEIFRQRGVERILDFGCGAGRHVIYLSKQGFEIYGIDFAEEGIKIAKRALKERCLEANLTLGNIFDGLPYKDNSFDAIVSVQVMHHGKEGEIETAISEMERVLKSKGLIFVTLSGRYSKGKTRYCLVKTARKIAPRTYVPTIGDEAGLIHYIYDRRTLKEHYKNFKIVDLWKDSNNYYCFLGENKKN